MKRARASALVLVNWKGVFYERYLLDANVTALEGANGAGKTTVMIAAYVVLLPDLARLRFTNLGETGATGGDKGIWGRLGDPARPSYSALLVELGDRQRVLLGVHLERKTEPTLSLTPFLVTEIDDSVRLQDLMLTRSASDDAIPTLDELTDNVRRHNAQMKSFGSVKEYFAKLFELGISPLRLAGDEERNKWNEMLRTSMTGGISRALTSELRSFVFKQDSGLSDTLGRMRSNLSACRQTRIEVAEARVLEQEISGIYDAGLGFFAASLLASRELAREAEASHRAALLEVDAGATGLRELESAAREVQLKRAALAERVNEADAVRVAHAETVRKIQRARQVLERLRGLEPELEALRVAAEQSRAERETAVSARKAAVQERDLAQQAVRTTAEGIANLQTGLDELHRQVHAHRQARALLASVRERVALDEPTPQALARAERDLAQDLNELDAELARRDRELRGLGIRRQEFVAARAALAELEGKRAPKGQREESELYQRAQAALQHVASLELTVTRLPELVERQAAAAALGLRQQSLLRQLIDLDFQAEDAEELPTGASLWSHVRELEARLARLDSEFQRAEGAAREESARLSRLDDELAALEARKLSYATAADLAQRLSEFGGELTPERAALRARRTQLELEREELLRKSERGENEASELAARAARLEVASGAGDPALLEMCDELDGELLARRYDDVEPHAAARLEATLGPLVDAVVVPDVELAAAALQRSAPTLSELHLVRAGEGRGLPESHPDVDVPGYVAVKTAYGLRLSRVADAARLGPKARQRALERLRGDEAEIRAHLESTDQRRRVVERALADLSELQEFANDWIAGDPAPILLRLRAERSEIEVSLQAERERLHALQQEQAEQRARLSTLQGLLSEAHLLDLVNQTALASELADTIAQARGAQAELLRAAPARAALQSGLEALRSPPLSDAEVERWERERADVEARRDALFALHGAVLTLQRERAALGWGDAERALSEKVQLAPELEAAHERAKIEARAADARHAASEQAWELAVRASQQTEAKYEAAAAHAERMRREAELEGIQDASDTALLTAQALERSAAQALGAVATDAATLASDVGRVEERLLTAREKHEALWTKARTLEVGAKAARSAFETALEAAARAGVSQGALSESIQSEYAAWTSTALASEARSKLALLTDRLARARGGAALADVVASGQVNDSSQAVTFESALGTWLEVRGWLAQRVPARIAEQGEALAALQRLREDLRALEGRLTRQESELRGNSEDVARNIDVQTRRAGNQVRRLNQTLRAIHFGSIAGIRIQLGRVERMDQVLAALRAGEAQSLLFQSQLPIEEALDEIFKRFGGGKGAGHRLLDYREYLELSVEIQRQTDGSWELANPSRLSTGEAIGVGAALMMVILTEWERDANLLRAERTQGTLRFLFLDEANRLSRDNLGTLFELCQNLDLQLLIAAPEVAHVDGNTTYRLVRRVTEDGGEEVIASGRRASLPSAEVLQSGAASESQ